jgi:predicted component of type VI protein secretion system
LDSTVKDDESAEHIVRSSILKLLREDESGSADSSPQSAVRTSVESVLDDMWALRSNTRGSPVRFEA